MNAGAQGGETQACIKVGIKRKVIAKISVSLEGLLMHYFSLYEVIIHMLDSQESDNSRFFHHGWHSIKAGCLTALLLGGLLGCESLDSALVGAATVQAIQAVTLTDSQIIEVSRQAAVKQDESNTVAPDNNPYAIRLRKLVKPHYHEDGIKLNYKVYLADSVNAFAMADGTVRVYSGLMDKMTDTELLFVIGHEIGHVRHGHSRKAAQVAYTTSAVRTGIAAVGGTVGSLAQSTLGEISEKIVTAQFSQKEEIQADDYGLSFLQRHGYPAQSAVTGLRKLGSGGGGLLSSHPDSNKRAARIEQKIR